MGLIERFVSAVLRQRPFVLLCLAALVLTGVAAFWNLSVEAFPDLTNNQVVVIAEAPGLGAIEVEQRVTYPVETALMGVAGADEVRSISKFGLALITVVFEDQVPIYLARQLVTERLNEVRGRIPEGIDPVLGPVATAFGEIYQYLVEGGSTDLMTRKTIHDWDVRTRLRSVKGVSEVNSWGGLTKQFHVITDPRQLEKYGLALHDVLDAVAENNSSFGGGFIEYRSERFTVRGIGLARTAEDIARTVVASIDGTPIFLGDVAKVEIAPMPRQGAVTHDGKGESVSGMVIMLKGENGKQVAQRAKARIAEIQSSLPSGVTIEPFYDQTEVIDRTSHTVARNLIEGSALVTVILFIFLRDIRASLIVAGVIPISMLVGFLGMRLFGVSANLMSLGALDFGLIVDGGVVMMENFVRRRTQWARDPAATIDRQSRHHELFVSAATEVARPILFGVLIIIAVYLPIFTLEGLEGKMFRPMAITVCSAIFGSLVLSLTAVPVVSSYLLRLEASAHESRWFEQLRSFYLRALDRLLNRRRRTLTVAGIAVTAALVSVPFLGTEFMPRLDEGSILIETRKLPAVSLEESVEISTRVEQRLLTFPEVREIVTKIGRPDLATEAMGIYQGDVYVMLEPRESWTTGRSKEELIDAMAGSLDGLPGISYNFTQPMAMRLDEVVSGVKADVAIKIFGPDPAVLERLGNEVREVLATVRGAADLQVEVLSGARQLEIIIDRQRIARFGINVAEVRELVETAIGGTVATELIDGIRRFGVLVRFPERLRADPESVGRLLLNAPGGERVQLDQVATVRTTNGPEAVTHENGQRRLVVQCNVRGRDMGGVVADAQGRIAEAVTLPPGYYITWGGQFENQQRAMRRLTIVVPLSLAIIFTLLLVTFGRARLAGLVIMNVPFALVGGVGALWIRGLNLNLSASIGFIALFGVAVLNGVVLITSVNRLRESGMGLREAVVTGAGTRLKPVMMTAIAEVVAMLPMATATSAGAEVQRPLATVVVGGIMTSSLLTLVVLPTLYEIIEHRAARHREVPGLQ